MSGVRGADAGKAADLENRVAPAGLALVGTHAERGVALGEFDVIVAFADRELEIRAGDVVLQIDECPVTTVVVTGADWCGIDFSKLDSFIGLL